MLTIDGSMGEGGGQILRTALALSLSTCTPFRIVNIRSARKNPGLRRQHLTAVLAAARIGQAGITGAELGSQFLEFSPRGVDAGNYRFDIGTAGSTSLVLQTILPALLTVEGKSELELIGGTHNPNAPPFEFIADAYLPLVNQMGPRVSAELIKPGFYPAGGGMVRVSIEPVARLQPLDLFSRGAILKIRARAVVANLPLHIAERELTVIQRSLELKDSCLEAKEIPSAMGAGNVVMLALESEHVTEVFSGFGMKGIPAERVAGGLVKQAQRYLAAGVPVGEHLADQLVLPLALARGGGFTTLSPSLHTTTVCGVVEKFFDASIAIKALKEDSCQITVG